MFRPLQSNVGKRSPSRKVINSPERSKNNHFSQGRDIPPLIPDRRLSSETSEIFSPINRCSTVVRLIISEVKLPGYLTKSVPNIKCRIIIDGQFFDMYSTNFSSSADSSTATYSFDQNSNHSLFHVDLSSKNHRAKVDVYTSQGSKIVGTSRIPPIFSPDIENMDLWVSIYQPGDALLGQMKLNIFVKEEGYFDDSASDNSTVATSAPNTPLTPASFLSPQTLRKSPFAIPRQSSPVRNLSPMTAFVQQSCNSASRQTDHPRTYSSKKENHRFPPLSLAASWSGSLPATAMLHKNTVEPARKEQQMEPKVGGEASPDNQKDHESVVLAETNKMKTARKSSVQLSGGSLIVGSLSMVFLGAIIAQNFTTTLVTWNFPGYNRRSHGKTSPAEVLGKSVEQAMRDSPMQHVESTAVPVNRILQQQEAEKSEVEDLQNMIKLLQSDLALFSSQQYPDVASTSDKLSVAFVPMTTGPSLEMPNSAIAVAGLAAQNEFVVNVRESDGGKVSGSAGGTGKKAAKRAAVFYGPLEKADRAIKGNWDYMLCAISPMGD